MNAFVDIIHLVNAGDLTRAGREIAALTEPYEIAMARGAVAMRQRQWLAAHDEYMRALSLRNNDITTLTNLFMTKFEMGWYESCAADCERVILMLNGHAKAWQTLGACHGMRARWPEALACTERACCLSPQDANIRQSMGMLMSTLGMDREAFEQYSYSLELDPANANARCGRAATLLRMGRWVEGWRDFEARWRLRSPVAPWSYRGEPLYEGDLEGLRGKRVLLRSEQGYGDAIQFARYVEPLSKIAASITLETQSELVRLFAPLKATILTAPKMENQVRAVMLDEHRFDVQTSLMSLPLLFETTAETCPPPVRLVTSPDPRGFRIGVCPIGGPRPEDPAANAIDRMRSIPPDAFQLIIDAAGPGVALLTKEALGDGDWQDTANLVAGLDLVITVDTAIAHLAGSLGVPVWVLSRLNSCWRFAIGEPKTPWYPSMKLFHQTILGDWESVIKTVVLALKERADG